MTPVLACPHGMSPGRLIHFACFGTQVREQSAWFWAAPEGGPCADDIRAGMGDFGHIRCVAKYAARMGQCFSSTVETARDMEVQHVASFGGSGLMWHNAASYSFAY